MMVLVCTTLNHFVFGGKASKLFQSPQAHSFAHAAPPHLDGA